MWTRVGRTVNVAKAEDVDTLRELSLLQQGRHYAFCSNLFCSIETHRLWGQKTTKELKEEHIYTAKRKSGLVIW